MLWLMELRNGQHHNRCSALFRACGTLCLIRLFGGLALLGVSFLTQAANYTLAVVPQASPAETYRRWAPFAEQLQRVTGQHLQLRVYRSFDEFETDLVNGLADFAYMNPYHFLMAHRVQGYLPLVRDGSRLLSGQLLVRRDSPLKSVKELNGKTIAFPDPNAFAASLYMRALLREKANIRFTASYLGTHANVYRHVVLGERGGRHRRERDAGTRTRGTP